MASEVAGDDAGGKVGGVGEGVGDAEVGKDGTQDDANATKAMAHDDMHTDGSGIRRHAAPRRWRPEGPFGDRLTNTRSCFP